MRSRPRFYAADIFKLPLDQWGGEILKRVPMEWQGMVRDHLRTMKMHHNEKVRKEREPERKRQASIDARREFKNMVNRSD